MRVGVVGLGTMGAPMARNVLRAGHGVTVHNRTREREEPLADAGASRAESPGEAALGADAVLLSLSDGPDVEEVVLGNGGVLETLAPGAVVIDTSTVSPRVARRLAGIVEARGGEWVDAPVSGGVEGAEQGTLTIFCGGRDHAVRRARPVLDAIGRAVTHLGPAGSGQAAKSVNQLLLAGAYASLAEGLVYAERAGLPLEPLVEALQGGAADSWVLRNRGVNVITDAYPLGFRLALHLKDLRIALEEARAAGLELEVAGIVSRWEERLVEAGYGDEDVSAIARVVRGA